MALIRSWTPRYPAGTGTLLDDDLRDLWLTNFSRTETALPENMVDGDKIDAKYKDGILQLKLPKLEHAKKKPPRQIDIT